MQSYIGEWAILDGQRGLSSASGTYGSLIGLATYDLTGASDLKYWRFERLELKGGGSSDGTYASAFWGNGGPFHFRNCYIHDNLATMMNNNPAGLTGQVWHDSIVEYCYFNNNGSDGTVNDSHNSAHINIYSDYNQNTIAEFGFTNAGHSITRNEYRYNIFVGSQVGVKHKQDQFLTGRNPSGGHGYDDTYKAHGDKIHHNIFQNQKWGAIDARQDFVQIYNNIVDSSVNGIKVGEDDTRSIYKSVIYNNTIISPTEQGINRAHNKSYTFLPSQYYGYEYNNILDNVRDGWNWSDTGSVTTGWGTTLPDFTTLKISRDYFYRPNKTNNNDLDGTKLVYLNGTRYNLSAYMNAYPGSEFFLNLDNVGDPLYQGNSEAQKYKTRGSHVLSGIVIISSGGIGGPHPYLSGVTLPAYIGATKPNDNAWVSGVLGLANVTTLQAGTASDPSWVEGSGAVTDTIPPAVPMGLGVM